MRVVCRFDDLRASRAWSFVSPGEVVVARRLDEVAPVLAAADAALAVGHHVAGFLSYEAAGAFDPALVTRDPGSLPLAWFAVFDDRISIDPVVAPDELAPGAWRADVNADEHADAIVAIKEKIADGWTYQVNFTLGLTKPLRGDPFDLYRLLASRQGGAHHGYLETDEFAICCASPELFFSLSDGVVTCRPMKGTAARGRFAEEDDRLAAAILSSEKERAENLMIVDLIRNDLGRIAAFGSVRVPELFALERYPTVWQMTSTVTADVDNAGLGTLFAALFPCGSVTGAPKASTMSLIAELERAPRGPYCGAFGWASPSDRGVEATFAVPIRTAVADLRSGVARYGVGSGITIGSDPGAEYAEVEAKRSVLVRPTGTFRLLETFRRDPEEGCRNLDGHLDRMAWSAEQLGYRFDRGRLLARLDALPATTVAERVRVLLSHDGSLEIDLGPLEPDVADGVVRLAIGARPVRRGDRTLFHKTTDRARYEAVFSGVSEADDVVLSNEEGEVTETTRASILVSIGGRWWTPPLDCGLLPGVGRATLLGKGEVDERVITLAELRAADALETVSSLRGRRPAILVG